MKWLNLIVGGIAGTLARYVCAGAVYAALGTGFPFGTLVVNIIGCWAIGFLAALSEEKFLLDPNARVLLMAGFCGAFTTFSTFMLETADLLRDGETVKAAINVGGSIGAGFLAFWCGQMLAKLV